MTSRKKGIRFAICMAFLLLAFPATAGRAIDAHTFTETRGFPAPLTLPRADDVPDGNDALFYGYLKQLPYIGRGKASDVDLYASSTAGNHLSGFDRTLYDLLKAEIKKVAAGERESTIFRFTAENLGLKGRAWTATELGISVEKTSGGQLTDATWNAVWEPLYRAIGHDREKSSSSVMDKLLVDCPYELYWFAKSYESAETSAAHWSYHWSVRYNENKGFSFADDAYLDVEMIVAENYAKSADDNRYYTYKMDTALAKKAAATAAGAKKIVDANTGRSDFEKLTAYRDAICDLVSYDYDAAKQGSETYGNGAWQLIWVFDGDNATNVVCEGYAKAFQYLCELSDFSGDVASYIITGDLIDRRGTPGPHMWNHVRIDGRYWLVDVTNCDLENVSRDWLFFKAPYEQTVQGGKRSYAFARNGEVALRYTNLENVYEAEEVLILTQTDYVSTPSRTSAPDSGNNDSGETHDTGATQQLDWSVTYPVHVTNGFSDFTEAPEGLAVQITANPAPTGQRFLSWGGAGGLIFLHGDVSSAAATFIMPPEALYITAVYEEVQFSDVEPGAYYQQPVAWAVSHGVTTGTTPTTFNPHDTCTRAQILTFLYRAAGEPEPSIPNPFSDVTTNDYFARAARWAAEHGLVHGTEFHPTTPCTRSAVMVYLWKLAGSPTGSRNPFDDVSPDAEYAEAVAWAVSRGITTGTTPYTFVPNQTCTRAQIVTFLYRHLVETGGTLTPAVSGVPAAEDEGETYNPELLEPETPL